MTRQSLLREAKHNSIKSIVNKLYIYSSKLLKNPFSQHKYLVEKYNNVLKTSSRDLINSLVNLISISVERLYDTP